MKTIADIKRALIPGSLWKVCFHSAHNRENIGEVSRKNSVGVYFWRERDGNRFESFLDWPKKDNVKFIENGFEIYWNIDGNLKLNLTYTKI